MDIWPIAFTISSLLIIIRAVAWLISSTNNLNYIRTLLMRLLGRSKSAIRREDNDLLQDHTKDTKEMIRMVEECDSTLLGETGLERLEELHTGLRDLECICGEQSVSISYAILKLDRFINKELKGIKRIMKSRLDKVEFNATIRDINRIQEYFEMKENDDEDQIKKFIKKARGDKSARTKE